MSYPISETPMPDGSIMVEWPGCPIKIRFSTRVATDPLRTTSYVVDVNDLLVAALKEAREIIRVQLPRVHDLYHEEVARIDSAIAAATRRS